MGIENKILVDNNVDDFIDINLDKNNDIELYSSYNTKLKTQVVNQQQQQQQQQTLGIPISYNKFFKEKIRKQYAFNMGFPRFDSNLYPVEMSNYLTEQEYKSSIDQINQVINHYRRISNVVHGLLGFESLGLFITSIICFCLCFKNELYYLAFLGIVTILVFIILSSFFIVFIVHLKRKAFRKVNEVTFQLNQVYHDRGVRFEIVRKSYNSCKGYVYYPNYSFPFSQQPQVQLYHLPLRSPLPPPVATNHHNSNSNNNNNNNNNNSNSNNKYLLNINNSNNPSLGIPTQA